MVHVLDLLAVAPGHLDEVRRRVRDDYGLVMTELDVQLVHTWMSPAVELVDRPTELLLLWEVPDVAAFWRARRIAAEDARVLTFWDAVTPLLAGRERKLLCDPADTTVLR